MTQRDDAVDLVTLQCAASAIPALTDDEIETLVDAVARWTTWKPSTAHRYGDVVEPTVPNGHLYRCIVAGTSGTIEPFWPLYTSPDTRRGVTRPHWHGFIGPLPGSQVTDSGTLVWAEAGFDDEQQYDTQRATYKGWLLKAARAAGDYDVQDGDDKYSRSQRIAQCRQMAQLYAPDGVA